MATKDQNKYSYQTTFDTIVFWKREKNVNTELLNNPKTMKKQKSNN